MRVRGKLCAFRIGLGKFYDVPEFCERLSKARLSTSPQKKKHGPAWLCKILVVLPYFFSINVKNIAGAWQERGAIKVRKVYFSTNIEY